ncbi:MAG: bifunctional heptose 7-phosphate kinase/heptose 1-phosphate adenyltransferase [Salinisphaeraceae bacterium]|nr:bifunctional heptose 7-phosphate kinase/heptose 1-phosphate adenyltransferase [Salinisphaeraceae bacterium]
MLSVPSFTQARVLVVGDIMLDRYWHGDTGRISPEAPVPVVRIGREERRLGGAANVALNLASVGVQVTLLGIVGDDEAGRQVEQMLEQAGVQAQLLRSPSHPTIAKLRVISRNQQLIRLDFEQRFDTQDAFDESALTRLFDTALPGQGAVICSDYGKGSLAGVQDLLRRAREAGVPALVDPKGDDWDRYRGAALITPNLSEFEAVAGAADSEQALRDNAAALRERLTLDALLVTRSEQGMTLFSEDPPAHFPAFAKEVFDVTGAGDTVIALFAAALAAGQDRRAAAGLANLAAGVVVAKLGTATVSPPEMRRAARQRHHAIGGVMSEDDLLALREEAREHGERVVMTNGCFDLLHPGHLRYLEAARERGDWLIVAVNDDASVTRLKGEGRPVNDLASRMEMLGGLTAVDWVVAFSEDTPERLICRVQPDVLVKGGDYDPETIAGADCVRAAGGRVEVLDFVEGHSSTRIIERMRRDS